MKEYLDVSFEIKESSLLDDGTFEGYASMFGGEPDSYGDVVERGAFSDSIKSGGRNGFGVSMLWQHDSSQPIGTWKHIEEDKKGLYVVGKLTRGVQKADEAYLLVKDKALRGLSIGYDVQDFDLVDGKTKNSKVRRLKKLRLWEISPVTFPALVRAQITNVKAIENAKTERELEAALREAGLSQKVSMILVNRCKSYLREIREQKGIKDVLRMLKEMNTSFLIQETLSGNRIKSAIPFKSYPLADENVSWDGGKEIRNASSVDLKEMCTWYDSENSDVKSSYKLPHHTVEDYKTVWKGVSAAMAALLGARGGVNIPEADKKACYNHLAKHYKEFDKEVPEM